METINVDIGEVDYEVHIARDLQSNVASFLAENTKNPNVLIVTDEHFANYYAHDLQETLSTSAFNVAMYVMKGGKVSKTFNEVLKIYGVLETNDYARDSTLIALGGGVIGDLAGFVASTWYRGMNMIHMPTTLMGMVDSSIGGKVAINYRDTINAVGNYYHPIANFMDINLIDTLPERDYISGLAEVVKCGLIADKDLLEYLEKNSTKILDRETDKLVHCIRRSIEIKVDHVKNDIREGGKRLLLNYGHTLGHAIEMATQTDKHEALRHGEGVSIGMSAVLSLGETYIDFPSSSSDYARSLLQSLQLPTEISASELGYERSALIEKCMKLMQKDKKRKNNQLRFILLDELGCASTYTGIENDSIIKAFESVIKK